MRKLLVITLFGAGFGLLVSCSGNSTTAAETKAKADSLKALNAEAAAMAASDHALIHPPDTAYSGDYVDRYQNGVIKFTGFYRFGKRHGEWMAFYLNGEKWSQCFFDKGQKHGASNIFYPNGKPQITGWNKHDLKDSLWVFYDTLGVETDRKYFRNDVEVALPAGMEKKPAPAAPKRAK